MYGLRKLGIAIAVGAAGCGDFEGPVTPTSSASADATGVVSATGGDGGLSCSNPLACATADVIGEMSGDSMSEPLVTSGDDTTWVTFFVSEKDGAVAGRAMSVRITLESPPGLDFDLGVYRGIVGAAAACGGEPFETMSTSSPEFVRLSWGEGGVANGIDDGAWIAVEIRAKNDTCEPGSEWTLTAEGDA